MPKQKQFHVEPRPNGGWQVKQGNSTRPSFCTKTKNAAIKRAKKMAENDSPVVFVHAFTGPTKKLRPCYMAKKRS